MKQTVWHHLKLCPQGDPQHTLADAAIAVRRRPDCMARRGERIAGSTTPHGRAKTSAARG